MTAPRDPDAAGEDRLSRLVALGAVLATLLAGLVAYLLVSASGNGSAAGLDADKLGLQAMGELTRTMSDSEAAYEAFLLGHQQRTHEALALHEGLLTQGSEGRTHDLARERWAELAGVTERAALESFDELPSIDPSSLFGPEHDPSFPERFFASATQEAVRLAALQDAANEEASAWGAKSAQYVAILTMFGVALYLLALLSVSMQTEVKRVFAVMGAVLLGAGALWTVVVMLGDVQRAPDSAAERFAAGHVALATAHTRADYDRAVTEYTAAIDARDTFARAYFERAEAVFLSGSPQSSGVSVLSPTEALESVTAPWALEAANADLLKARELGLSSSVVLGRLGFNTFLQGLREQDPGLYAQSIEYTREAIALAPGEPVWHFNLAVAMLADGRYPEAREAYDDGLRYTLFESGRSSQPRKDTAVVELLAAEALTDLELVASSSRGDAELTRQTDAVKERIVASASHGAPAPAGPSATLGEVDLEVLPSEAAFSVRGRGRGFDARRDDLAAQLYYSPAGGDVAYVVPEASGSLEGRYVRGGSLHYLSTTSPPRCLPDGDYRLELYVNGNLVGSDTATARFGDLHQAAAAPDLDLGTCVPEAWEVSAENRPGLVYGRTSRDGDRGAFLLRFDWRPHRDQLDSGYFADAALRLLPFAGARLQDAQALGEFLELRDPQVRTYRDGARVIRVRVGIDDEGAAVAALVFGPSAYMRTQEPAVILDAVFAYEPEVHDPSGG